MSPVLGSAFPQDTDAILFLDETGTGNYFDPADLVLCDAAIAAGRNPPFTIAFGLSGVLFRRADYVAFDADFKTLKQRHLGTSVVAIHEFDLRDLKKAPFNILRDPLRWTAFRNDLSALLNRYDFRVIIVAFHKLDMQRQYPNPFHPYYYGLEVILERVVMERRHFGATWRIIAEDRATGLNDDLNRELLRLQLQGCGSGILNPRNNVSAAELRATFDPMIVFLKKTDNDSGLQVADLAAGPITRHVYGLDARETRTVKDIVLPKLCAARNGNVRGFGIKCFPVYPPGCPR